jgi:hypothetical protein
MRLKKLRSAGVGVWATALDTANSIITRAHFICVFQQTLQNVSNPLSIAHDSRVGDWIVADSGSTAGIGQIKKMHRPAARAGK